MPRAFDSSMCQHCFVCIWSVERKCPPVQRWRPRQALVLSVGLLQPDGITAADLATLQQEKAAPGAESVSKCVDSRGPVREHEIYGEF